MTTCCLCGVAFWQLCTCLPGPAETPWSSPGEPRGSWTRTRLQPCSTTTWFLRRWSSSTARSTVLSLNRWGPAQMIEELQSGQRNKLGLLIIKQNKRNSENKRKGPRGPRKKKSHWKGYLPAAQGGSLFWGAKKGCARWFNFPPHYQPIRLDTKTFFCSSEKWTALRPL